MTDSARPSEGTTSQVSAAPEPVYGKPFHGWSCECDECQGYDERGEPRPGEAPTTTAARRCVRCGTEVHPVAEIDGDDHHVLVETPMEMAHEPQGDIWKITVSQKAGLVSCKTLTAAYPEWWNAGVPTDE